MSIFELTKDAKKSQQSLKRIITISGLPIIHLENSGSDNLTISDNDFAETIADSLNF